MSAVNLSLSKTFLPSGYLLRTASVALLSFKNGAASLSQSDLFPDPHQFGIGLDVALRNPAKSRKLG